ncbi:MAG: hypothetical protein ACLFRI_04610 [Candidatus Izemoplasmataceae bacterium]
MKSILASSFVFLILIGTLVSFFYWEKTQSDYNFIHQGYTLLSVDDNLKDHVTLRPKGSLLAKNNVDEITYTYTFKIKKGLNIESFIEEKSLEFNQEKQEDLHNLIEVDVLSQAIISESNNYYVVEVQANVYLREAVNQDELMIYKALKSFSISLKPSLNS